jgi:hypothetical protein
MLGSNFRATLGGPRFDSIKRAKLAQASFMPRSPTRSTARSASTVVDTVFYWCILYGFMWQFPQVALPADGTVVWIIRQPYFDRPFQVTYNEFGAPPNWQWQDPQGFTHTLALEAAWKWRAV